MIPRLLAFLVVISLFTQLLLPPPLKAADFSSTSTYKGVPLEKVSEATFRWTLFKVYEAALYLGSGFTDSPPLEDIPKQLVLEYNVGIEDHKFAKSGDSILRDLLTPAEWDSLEDRVRQLNSAYKSVSKGDRYSLSYAPGKGTTLAWNEQPLVTIPGADFAAAYFSIWLGDHPQKDSLRSQLYDYLEKP